MHMAHTTTNFDPVQGQYRRQDRGRDGALATPGVGQLAFATPRKQRIEQKRLRGPRSQLGGKLAEDGGIAPRTHKLQA